MCALKLRSADLYSMLQRGIYDWDLGGDRHLTPDEIHQSYNALDSAVTLRVHEKLAPLVEASPHASTSYAFVRAMQGPALDMMRRGINVQQKVRQDETSRYMALRDRAQALLDRLADAVWGPEEYEVVTKREVWTTPIGKRGQALTPKRSIARDVAVCQRPRGLNAGSNKQCLAFFNTALGLPIAYEIRKTASGTERTPTANDKALRKWAERRMKGLGTDPRDRTIAPVKLAAPFVSLILTIRDADKMLMVLRAPLDPDGRMRCSYNVVGSETGRWSSSKNAFGRGANLQNQTPSMRRMFCADDGYRFISTDLEQAESRVVAGLVWQTTGDTRYWDACVEGDLHTVASMMAYPEMGWSDDPKENRHLADRPCPDHPHYTVREANKRFGHASNYRGSPYGIAQAVGVPVHVIEGFQRRYFGAFPGIPLYHDWVKRQLLEKQYLDTPLGRRRWFFSRPTEDSTLREAIAFVPQSTVGELLNLIMWKVWRRSLLPPRDPRYLKIQLLLQNHDAFAFQLPDAIFTSLLEHTIHEVNLEFEHTPIPLVRGDERRDLVIPGEFITGFNWAYRDKGSDPSKWTFPDGNPDGLSKWGGSDTRTRQQTAAVRSSDWLATPTAPRFGR